MKHTLTTALIAILMATLAAACGSPSPASEVVNPTQEQTSEQSPTIEIKEMVGPAPTRAFPTSKPASVTPTSAIILANDQPIKIQNYSILITYAGYNDIGYNPFGGSNTMAMQFGVTEETGKINEVIALNALITDKQGKWIETGAFQENGTNFEGATYLLYNILTEEPGGQYFLTFPTGEMIDLSPLVK